MNKILIIGFFAFSVWSALSTYIYVCKIKGLCDAPVTGKDDTYNYENVNSSEALYKPIINEQKAIPDNLVIYFAFDKSEFKGNAESDKYIQETNNYLIQNAKSKLSITGHTDAVGTDEYNQALGYRRAQSLQQYFQSKGIQVSNIVLESRGEKEPADDNNTADGRANNRRTVIYIKK